MSNWCKKLTRSYLLLVLTALGYDDICYSFYSYLFSFGLFWLRLYELDKLHELYDMLSYGRIISHRFQDAAFVINILDFWYCQS